MLQIALCCLEGTTMSNLVHRRRRCARIVMHSTLCLEGSTPEEREGLSLFIALRWMQDPGGVMMWLTENIQACLRIFRRTQHQWLARDILHQPQGVYSVFVLHPVSASKSVLSVVKRRTYPLAYCPPGRDISLSYIRGRCPPVTHGSALQAPERMWILMLCLPSRHQSACGY